MLHICTYSLLLVAVITLSIVAYSEHRNHEYLGNQYNEVMQQNHSMWTEHNAITLHLSRFANVTEIIKTEFVDNQQNKVKPSTIELYTDYNYVTLWFKIDNISRKALIHLPSWSENDYRSIGVPFFDGTFVYHPSQLDQSEMGK